jgi:hypothetical protein
MTSAALNDLQLNLMSKTVMLTASHLLHNKGYESVLSFNQTLRNDFSCTYMKWNVKRVSKRLADGPGLSARGFLPKGSSYNEC